MSLSVLWLNCTNLSSSYQVAVNPVNTLRAPDEQISTTGYPQQRVFDLLYKSQCGRFTKQGYGRRRSMATLFNWGGEPTHLARPETEETYCGTALAEYRPQGDVTDPSAFHAGDQFCPTCLQMVLGAQSHHLLL